MRGTRAGAVTLLWACSVVLVGCAGTTGSAAVDAAAPTDPFGCGIVVTPAVAVVGQDVLVSRPPTAPGEICATLAPGTTQTLELRSNHVHDSARQTASATVAADGSFEATLPVPTDIRLGQVLVTAIPPAEFDCTAVAAAAGIPEDCYFPRAQFTVKYDPDELSPVRIVTTEVETPAPPVGGESDSYAVAGPGENELTLTIYGSACPSRPSTFVHTADPETLKIVSAVSGDICAEPLVPWTTVIDVPDDYRDYRSVSVDNLATILLD